MATIRQCVDISILQHVASYTNAHELWHKLSTMYERKSALKKTSLMRKIVMIKYTASDNIHIDTFTRLVNLLASTKFPLDDVMQALLLICTLPDSWENLVVSLSDSCKNLTLQVVKTSILKEETRRKHKSVLSQSEANVAQNLGRGRSKHRSPQNKDKSHARSKSKGRLTCFKRIVDTLRRTKALLIIC